MPKGREWSDGYHREVLGRLLLDLEAETLNDEAYLKICRETGRLNDLIECLLHPPSPLHSICRHLPSDFQPYEERERDGPDCSSGCIHFLKLPGKLGLDWGVCANPASPRAGLLT